MTIQPQDLLAALNFRYATKAFDAARKIPAETWDAIEESLVLTPSSFGLQPWKFLIVENPDIRENSRPPRGTNPSSPMRPTSSSSPPAPI